MSSIYVLTLRQLTGKWRLLILALLAVVPPLMAVIATAGSNQPTPSELDDALLDGLLASAVLPIVVLAVATAAFGNEVEDRTLANLTLTPISRRRIVFAKLAATLSVELPPLVVGTVAGVLIAFQGAGFSGGGRAALAAAVGMSIGALLYSTLFVWAGLATAHPLAYGLLFVFVWEGLFSSFVNGIKYLSLRQYTLGLVKALDPARFDGRDLLGTGPTIAGATLVFTGFLVLAVRRLHRMDVP